MTESRTKNSIKNVKTGIIVQIINKLMSFAVRTVFIKILNTEYLGINGLFTNVLTLLSFAELGIGTAIVFNMYKPIAENDKEKIKSLMQFYKKTYNIIGTVVFMLGLLIIPFLKFIVKDTPSIKENIILIYLLFLINTTVSYFFAYKKSIISAHQKQSIINNIDSIFYLIISIFEILFLIITKEYMIYLCVKIVGTILENVILSTIANKKYPYLKDKTETKITKKEKTNIFDNVKSLIVYKFGTVIMNGTDNILISSLINVSTVGLYSNYSLIIGAIKSIILTSMNGITASIGNLNVNGTNEQKENILYTFTFVNYIIFSFCAIAFIILLNPFIEIWLGSKYTMNIGLSIVLAISFFVEGVRNPCYIYRTAAGLFDKCKITPYIGAITNIVLSIILCKYFGIVGIFIATIIAQLVSYSWMDPYLIHKYIFKTSITKYIKKYLVYIFVFTLNILLTIYICNSIDASIIVSFIYKCIIVCIVPNVINLVLFNKTDEFKFLKNKFLNS